jgi:hypothetical protein
MLHRDQIRVYRQNGYLVVAAPTREPRQVALPLRIPCPGRRKRMPSSTIRRRSPAAAPGGGT